MPVYLNEMEVGEANDVVGFPHLLVCMGIVAMTNNSMFGLHIDTVKPADLNTIYTSFHNFITGRGAGAITALYGSCNHKVRYPNAGNRAAAWQAEMTLLAQLLNNWHGPVRGFDTSIVAPKDGTFVQYVPNYGGNACAIYYKRNEKMGYTFTQHGGVHGAFNPNIKKIRLFDGSLNNVQSETTGSDIIVTRSNKGDLHELNYGSRLLSFNA